MVPMVVHDRCSNSPVCDITPLLGAMPTAQSRDNVVLSTLLNTCQCVSHFQVANTTQLGRRQLSPVPLQNDEPVLQLAHGGQQPLIMMYLGPKRWVVALLDCIIDVGAFIVPCSEKE